jgi:hypothetical protein
MRVSEALRYLGSKRVIWIDDCFNDTPAQLARVLVNSLEAAKACSFPELSAALESYQYDASGAEASIVQILTDVKPERVAAIKAAFFDSEGDQKQFATRELSAVAIERTCELLGVTVDDRWTFDEAERLLAAVIADGDADVSYIVDLNEAGGSKTRGLDILRTLWDRQSTGTAFILTHETDAAGEGQRESELRQTLSDPAANPIGIPVCVIAKERLYENPDAPETVEEALRIGIKRAGLRRSVFEVLARARDEIVASFDEATTRLLSIPPEQLESHVFERGYKEGVSELHVVERALTAHIAQHLRTFFGVDEAVQRSARRLRDLRHIELKPTSASPDVNLAAFRQAEVWESDSLINRAYTPIACGDVFETDPSEAATKTARKKFVILGQPCDISLRPEDKRRAQDTAFMVPLKKRVARSEKDRDPKAPLLPFKLDGDQWACDFRNATMVKLSVLDLASFRFDGRVRVDEGHSPPEHLLVGQHKVYEERTAAAAKALRTAIPAFNDSSMVDANLQLSFASNDAFKHVHCGTFEPETKIKADGVSTVHPKRVTWRLRRCGRIRMPYAAAILDQYVGVMSRQAFDLDYMTPGSGDGEQAQAAQLAESAMRGRADAVETQQSTYLAAADRDRPQPKQLVRSVTEQPELRPVREEISEDPSTIVPLTDGAAP